MAIRKGKGGTLVVEDGGQIPQIIILTRRPEETVVDAVGSFIYEGEHIRGRPFVKTGVLQIILVAAGEHGRADGGKPVIQRVRCPHPSDDCSTPAPARHQILFATPESFAHHPCRAIANP